MFSLGFLKHVQTQNHHWTNRRAQQMRFVVLITFKVTAGLIHPAFHLCCLGLQWWSGLVVKRLLTEKLHGSELLLRFNMLNNMLLFNFT